MNSLPDEPAEIFGGSQRECREAVSRWLEGRTAKGVQVRDEDIEILCCRVDLGDGKKGTRFVAVWKPQRRKRRI